MHIGTAIVAPVFHYYLTAKCVSNEILFPQHAFIVVLAAWQVGHELRKRREVGCLTRESFPSNKEETQTFEVLKLQPGKCVPTEYANQHSCKV